MQFLQGGKEIAAGKTGEGAVSTAEGSTTLFMTFAPYAEGVTVGSGGAAIAGALGAGALASGAIMLASNEARAAISGEKTAAVQAAEYYAGLAVEGEAEGGVKGVLKQTAGWTGGFFSTLIAVGQGY
jgi:hypothetical protein